MGVVALRVTPSEYTRGSIVGMAGEELPYDVSLDSDFACGWRFGRDMRLAAPLMSEIKAEDNWTIIGRHYGPNTTEAHEQHKRDDLPLTWPEGREGAAAMIPPHRIPVLPALYKDDAAAVRDMGSLQQPAMVTWGICDDPLGR